MAQPARRSFGTLGIVMGIGAGAHASSKLEYHPEGLLNDELSHRLKNVLAVVQSVVSQIFGGDP